MRNELQIFENVEFGKVRTIEKNDEVWFVAKDIAEILGYSNTNEAISRHCKGVAKHEVGVETGKKANGETAYQNIMLSIIPERDVYRLIMRSKLPTAEKFEEWVVGDVLPAIRKHGGYLTPQKIEEALLSPDTIIRLATDLKAEREKRLYQWLRDNNFVQKTCNKPTQKAVDLGVLKLDEGFRFGKDKELIPYFTTKVTGKGQIYFINKFKKVA